MQNLSCHTYKYKDERNHPKLGVYSKVHDNWPNIHCQDKCLK